MAFLFQDQNQGIRKTTLATRDGEAAATVLFHPDFDRRLRNCTESADPSSLGRKALAGLGHQALTAGGDFHPALRTSAARNGRPAQRYCQITRRGKRLGMANWHVPHVPGASLDDPAAAI